VVGIFSTEASMVRLVGVVLAEQHDEWRVDQRYLILELVAQVALTSVPALEEKEAAWTTRPRPVGVGGGLQLTVGMGCYSRQSHSRVVCLWLNGGDFSPSQYETMIESVSDIRASESKRLNLMGLAPLNAMGRACASRCCQKSKQLDISGCR